MWTVISYIIVYVVHWIISSQVYIWGGGKTTPQTMATFKKDTGAIKVCVAPKHFCVVTVEKELYTWSSGSCVRDPPAQR